MHPGNFLLTLFNRRFQFAADDVPPVVTGFFQPFGAVVEASRVFLAQPFHLLLDFSQPPLDLQHLLPQLADGCRFDAGQFGHRLRLQFTGQIVEGLDVVFFVGIVNGRHHCRGIITGNSRVH